MKVIKLAWLRFWRWRLVPNDWRPNPGCSCAFCKDYLRLTDEINELEKEKPTTETGCVHCGCEYCDGRCEGES